MHVKILPRYQCKGRLQITFTAFYIQRSELHTYDNMCQQLCYVAASPLTAQNNNIDKIIFPSFCRFFQDQRFGDVSLNIVN